MTEELAKQTWYLGNLTIIMISMGGAMIGFGVGLLVYGFFLYMTSSPTTVRPVYEKIEEQAAGAGGSGEEGDTIIEDMSEGVNDAEVDRTF